MNKTIKPEWCTTVDPSEYDIDRQMEDFVKAANKAKEAFYGIDVGKLWGLYLAFKEQQERIGKLEMSLQALANAYEARMGDWENADFYEVYNNAIALLKKDQENLG